MKRLLPILIILASLCACSENPVVVPPPTTTQLSAETSASQPEISISVDSIDESTEILALPPTIDSTFNSFLQFDLITLQVHREALDIEGNSLQSSPTDTLDLSLAIGSASSGQYYFITALDSSVEKVELYQQYETSMSISDEGKHMDLLDWKHHVSEWELLEMEGNTVMTPKFIPEEKTQFPTVKVKEIVKEVKRIEDERSGLKGRKNKNRHWSDLTKTMPAPDAYPGYVSISQVRVKILLTLTSGEQVERMIIYKIPMGC